MATFPTVPDQLAALAELDALLTRHGISYWLFGGWAVDFHVGRVTREHGDIDIAVWAVDHDRGRVYTPLRDGRADWPDDAFGEDRVALLGVPARIIGRGALVAEKSATRVDPVPAAKDRDDLATLAGPT